MLWLDESTPTGCVSMRSRRCCTSTIRARQASGFPTATAGVRTRGDRLLRLLNELAYRPNPDVQIIAEESTAWPRCRGPLPGGLGFGMKWNMGWMHDTLQYMRETL